ncbi:MAG: phosphate propanoyltransferase [Candidatus Eisenbacteria bacterium]|nr:phosphate propanoyltransferase [Candidatus Eisenbacteria bacterium]
MCCPQRPLSRGYDVEDTVERIAREVLRRLQGETVRRNGLVRPGGAEGIPVMVSARHVHLSRGSLESLFGEGATLTKTRDLTQPGEFVAGERVTAVGPSGRALESVGVVGPVRPYTQIELSRTDAVRLGIDPPVRRSGDLAGSAPVTLVGPAGTVVLREGAVRAMRHVHMTERDADEYGVKDGDLVRVRFPGVRALVLENVLVRVSRRAALEMHLDTDDANAADIRPPVTVEILS